MSRDGKPDLIYFVFDLCPGWTREAQRRPYLERLQLLEQWFARAGAWKRAVKLVSWERLESLAELETYEARQLEIGWEGVCLRALDAPYKAGRSTFNEHALLKLKRFEDFEATVVGVEERLHNGNLAVRNRLGQLERSSAKGGKTPMGTLGALICKRGDVTFNVGTGFTDEARAMLWAGRETLLGRVVKVKSQPYGEKDRPRLPVFLGFRDGRDL
jgi:DNA ligase 1